MAAVSIYEYASTYLVLLFFVITLEGFFIDLFFMIVIVRVLIVVIL